MFSQIFIQFKTIFDFLKKFPVIYLTSTTSAAAKKQKHKSLSSDNVFEALEEIEFESFVPMLRDSLDEFRKLNKEKKASKAADAKAADTSKTNAGNESNMEADESELNDGTEIEE